MISAVLKIHDQKLCSMTCSGHAQAAPYGEDLVCAAVSSIMTGALNGIDMLFPETCQLTMKANTISIQVNRDSTDLQQILHFIWIQLQTVHDSHPEYIIMEKKEV